MWGVDLLAGLFLVSWVGNAVYRVTHHETWWRKPSFARFNDFFDADPWARIVRKEVEDGGDPPGASTVRAISAVQAIIAIAFVVVFLVFGDTSP